MRFPLRCLTLEEMDRAATVHRASFDDQHPWLAGLHTPEEDRKRFPAPTFHRLLFRAMIGHEPRAT